MTFVHLHTHSEYSLLDGANRIDDLIRRAKKLGMPALALTDHGNLHGAWEFQEKARKAGLEPILGCEAYIAYGHRRSRDRPPGAPGDYAHLVLLALDRTGYRNLVRLSSIGYLEGFYRRPRIDHETLAEHQEGLVVLSACLSGEIAAYLRADRWEDARRTAEWYARLLGEDRYFLEVQDHGIRVQGKVNAGVFRLADELGLGVVATNDAHYLRREDADAHDTLLCIGTGKDKDDRNRLRFETEETYFKSAEEMRALFPDRPDALANTVAIAERCGVTFEQTYHLPAFPLPERFENDDAMLRHLVEEGARGRYGEPLAEAVEERLVYELGVIAQTGYAGYFLIVWDFIRAAKEREIPVGPGRGSAAGSIVAYCLGITDVDPLRFDLLFERFLNPDRVSMPDIDIDFCYERRGEVIDYVRDKYGHESVGQIVTFGTLKARAVVRDVGRVLGFTPQETDRLAKLIPSGPGYALTVKEATEKVLELKQLYEGEPRYRKLLDYAMRIEGLARHSSVHAAGVVIAPGPLHDYVPVAIDPKAEAKSGARNGGRNGGNGAAGGAGGGAAGNVAAEAESGTGSGDPERAERVVITQFDMNALEKAGMLKMDFLGLRTLTVIQDAVRAVRERHGVEVDWDEIGLEDPRTYEMLAEGRTSGVFQFESALATEKLRAMRSDRFEDLVAVNALIRPGPLDSGMTDVFIQRKRGFKEVSYPHPDLAEVLEPTYGVITYQEQVMRVANLLAGFTLAEADVLRKAVGKKDAELTDRVLEDFRARAVERGVPAGKARDIAELIRTFGRYGFNRAHSVAYALLSYRTAWLKAHYPPEFMAALLSSEIGNTDKVVSYIGEARGLGIEVLPPSVSESGYRFTVVDEGCIRFGLGAIKGVGHSAIRSIIEAREEAPFESFLDFLTRIDLRLNNKRVLESLVAAGALDEFGSRAALGEGLDMFLNEAQLRRRERESGQVSLFGGGGGPARPAPTLPEVEPWSEQRRLKEEKARLGFYISGHPLDRFRELVELYALEANSSNLVQRRDQAVQVACVVTEASVRTSRRDGREWARLTIEDFRGTATALCFGDAWQEHRELLTAEAPVLLTGTVSGNSRDEEDPPIFVDSARPLSEVRANGEVGVCIELREGDDLDPGAFRRARELLEEARGNAPLFIQWRRREEADAPEEGGRQVAVREGGGQGPGGERGPRGRGADGGNGTEAPRLASRSLRVQPSAALLTDLRALFGGDRVRLVRE